MLTRPDAPPQGMMTRRASILFKIAALGTIALCSSAPTPLYRIYQEHWGLSPVMVTMVFSAYALSLLVALLIAGGLSDFVGRRPVMFAAIALNAVALVVFIAADSVMALIVARTIQGLATGVGFGTIGAAMLDTHRAHGSLMNSLTPVTCTGIGALFSGVLVAFAPMPTQMVYILLLAVVLLQAVLVWWVPETVVRRPGAWQSLRPSFIVPPEARQALLLVMPGNVAVWALGGFYLSLMPSLLRIMTGSTSPLLGGIAVAALTFSGALSMLLARKWPGTTILIRSMASLIVGVAVTLAGVHNASIATVMTGTVIAGFGFGSGFFGSLRTVVPLAQPHQRAGLLSVIFIICYLALSLPTILAGLYVPTLGLPVTLYIYGAAVLVLSAISLTAILVSLRRA
ncbi:MAG: MFS transporter [Tardiphaga sp.]